MLPFAETLLAWRLHRGLTQDALARAAHIPRPNLSAMERGQRDITLRTLRALGVALDVRPGCLADGVGPDQAERPLGRTALERVARAAASDTSLGDLRQERVARYLGAVVSERLVAKHMRRRAGRQVDRSWLLLKSAESPETVASLIERTSGQRARR